MRTLTVRIGRWEVLAISVGTTPAPAAECDRPHREPTGFVAGSGGNRELRPSSYPTVYAGGAR